MLFVFYPYTKTAATAVAAEAAAART